MINRYSLQVIAVSAALALSASGLAGQSAAPPASSPADVVVADSGSPGNPTSKKKGGLFGKMKGLAQSKVVKAVAKTAACTMIPGGQFVAGAIDGASAKDAAKTVAKDAAVKAVVGGGIGGSACMPGLTGNAGGAIVPGAGVPGMPSTGLTGVGMSAVQMRQLLDQYRKMGMDPAQLQAMEQMMAEQMQQVTSEK